MRFVCEKCKTKYTIADERVRKKILKIRCKTCSSIIVVREAEGDNTVKAVVEPSPMDDRRGSADRAVARTGSSRVSRSAVRRETRPAQSAASSQLRAVPALADADAAAEATLLDEEYEGEPTRYTGAPDFKDQAVVGEGEWYFAVEGNQFGPMSLIELCSRVRRGETGDEAFVWRDGFDDWVDIQAVPELKPYLPKHPPPPPKGKSGVFALGGMAPPSPAASSPSLSTPLFPEMPTPSGSGLFPPAPSPGVVGSGPLLAPQPAAAPQASAMPKEASGVFPPPQLVQVPADGAAVVSTPTQPPAPTPAPVTVPPSAARTPTWMIIAGIGGGLAAICGVFLVVYSIFFDRPSTELTEQAIVGETQGQNLEEVGVEKAPPAADAGQAIAFSPIEVERSTKPVRRRRSSRDKAIAKLGNLAEGAQVARERRLSRRSRDVPDLPATTSTTSKSQGRGNSAQRPRDHVPRIRRRRIPMRRITAAEILSLQKRNRRSLKSCYERALKRDDSLMEIKAEVTVTIEDDGVVNSVEVEAGESSDLAICIQRAVKRWAFPAIGEQSFGFPIIFRGS